MMKVGNDENEIQKRQLSEWRVDTKKATAVRSVHR